MSARKVVTLWWVSWKEFESPEDTRPIHDPPNEDVIAWWESGFAGDESYATMVALVNAESKHSISSVIEKDWPSKKRRRKWRFQELVAERPVVIGDRFPFSKWSVDRLKALGVPHDVTCRRKDG